MELIKIDPIRRRKYRFVIYITFGILLATLVGSTWVLDTFFRPEREKVWTEEELLAQPGVEMFQQYVQIDTSQSGNEVEGAEFLAEQLESVGIPTYIERLGDRHANLWGILEGEEPGAVVLHNHIDVYEVTNPEAWTHPPFSGQIDGPWMYSRGVFDMKSLAITQVRALQELATSGVKPKKSVIFLATSGEETGSDLGVRWILDKHPDLVERFDIVLTEGGVVEPKSREDIKYWGVEFAQKRFATLWVCGSNRERLEELRRDIVSWRLSNETWVQTDEVDLFSAAYAGSRESSQYRKLLENPWETLHDPQKFRMLPDYLKAIFREEAVPFPVEETEDGNYRVRVLLHLLPGSEVESLRSRLLPDWMLHGLAVSEEPPLGSDQGSPTDLPAFQTVLETVRDFYPDTLVGPHFLAWSATDSRFFREAGIPSYGFSPFLIFSTDTYRVDAIDERISLPGFMSGLDLYVETVKRLAS